MVSGPAFSVVIATYNRARELRRTLQAVAAQTCEPGLFELLIVDNACTDNTAATIAEFQATYPHIDTRLIPQPHKGLGRARNAGLAAARADYVAFLDDDAVPVAHWLEEAQGALRQLEKAPAGLGGPVVPEFEINPPQWYKASYEASAHGVELRPYVAPSHPPGCNMFIRKDVCAALGGFEVVGMQGEKMEYGDETAFFARVRRELLNEQLLYVPRMTVHHQIPAFKLGIVYQLKRQFQCGQSWWLTLEPGRPGWRISQLARALASCGLQLTRALWALPRARHWQNWLIEDVGRLMWSWGRLVRGTFGTVTVRGRLPS